MKSLSRAGGSHLVLEAVTRQLRQEEEWRKARSEGGWD